MRLPSSSADATFLPFDPFVVLGWTCVLGGIVGFILGMAWLLLVDGRRRCRECGGRPLFTTSLCAACSDDAARWVQEWTP